MLFILIMDSLEEIEKAVDKLLAITEKLVETSQQIVSEEVLQPIQEEQEKMIALLEKIESDFQKHSLNADGEKALVKKRIGDKLSGFQKLNEQFIRNISAYRKLINLKKPD